MKKLKFAALGLAAVITLAGCATANTEAAPLPITGEEGLSPADIGGQLPDAILVRDQLVQWHLTGLDVTEDMVEACYQLANLDGVYLDENWVLQCENPEYSWDFYTNTWVVG